MPVLLLFEIDGQAGVAAGLYRFASAELKQTALRREGRRNQQPTHEAEIPEFGPVSGIAASFPD